MGRGYQELSVTGELAHLPFRVIQRPGDAPGRDVVAIDVDGQLLTPPEISALLLRELKDRASAGLGRPVSRAVATSPGLTRRRGPLGPSGVMPTS